MSNLSKIIKDWMCITLKDVRYFLSQNTDSKVLYRNRFDFMIIKGNKVLTIPGNAHKYQNEVYMMVVKDHHYLLYTHIVKKLITYVLPKTLSYLSVSCHI